MAAVIPGFFALFKTSGGFGPFAFSPLEQLVTKSGLFWEAFRVVGDGGAIRDGAALVGDDVVLVGEGGVAERGGVAEGEEFLLVGDGAVRVGDGAVRVGEAVVLVEGVAVGDEDLTGEAAVLVRAVPFGGGAALVGERGGFEGDDDVGFEDELTRDVVEAACNGAKSTFDGDEAT